MLSLMADKLNPDLHAWMRKPLGQRVYALERKLAVWRALFVQHGLCP